MERIPCVTGKAGISEKELQNFDERFVFYRCGLGVCGRDWEQNANTNDLFFYLHPLAKSKSPIIKLLKGTK
jgi:hypothetical protein